MIYEKKGYSQENLKFKNDMICPSPAKCSIIQYKREEIVPYVQQPQCYRKLKKAAKKRYRKNSKKRLVPKFAVIIAALVFCLFVTDAKFFDGAVANRLYCAAKKELLPILDSLSPKPSQQPPEQSELRQELPKESQEHNFISDENTRQSQNGLHWEQQLTFENTADEMPNQSSDKQQNIPIAVSSSDNTSLGVDGEIYYPITELDLSAQSVAVLSNNTSYKPDMESFIDDENIPSALRDIVITDQPLVLIVHTHGSECYTKYDGMYPKSENTRSEDIDENVVRVGKEIANTLEIYGIPVLHLETMCDKESFIDAYNVSNRLVTKALQDYPSIRIVIDVHRDAIIRDSGESIKPTVAVAGQDYAQLMFVVGTDEAGYNHPAWRENLSFAATLQKSAEKRYPGLFRPINLRPVPFNQWLSEGYILLEVGSNVNTLDEALLSAQAFGHTLGAVIKEA